MAMTLLVVVDEGVVDAGAAVAEHRGGPQASSAAIHRARSERTGWPRGNYGLVLTLYVRSRPKFAHTTEFRPFFLTDL
jgi:hypothetical protein